MTDDAQEIVLIAERTGHYNQKTYHTDPDCHQLERSGGDPVEKSLNVLSDSFEECGWCAGDVDTSHPDDYDPRRYKNLLVDADPDDIGLPMTDGGEEMVAACPNCDSARIGRRTKTSIRRRWRCRDCEARFDEAVERPSRGSNVSTHGPARALEQADPDDLVSDGDPERRSMLADRGQEGDAR
jgi:ribosomal protein L37AE/L43A